MRTFLIIFITLVVIGGAFALYIAFQDPVAKRPPKSLATGTRSVRAGAATSQFVHGIGSGDNPWVKRFEKGELASMFRGARWEPKGGDLVQVTSPEAEFFSGNGEQRLRVEGVSGDVIMPGGGQPQASTRTPGAAGNNFTPPSRGLLQTVKISMFEPADAPEPTLVATMPNAAFDNDTFRIATEAYTDESGKRVEADQVPVVVDGRDYAFRGRGLVIRWNQLDRKLQLLEVAHGESLTVKNLSRLSAEPAKVTQATPTTRAAANAIMRTMLASADSHAFVLAAAAADPPPAKKPPKRRPAAPPPPPPPPVTVPTSRPKLVRDLSPVVYRATFDRDVNIFQADQKIAIADLLQIDIMQEPQEDPTTKPATLESTAEPTTRSARRGRKPAAEPSAASAATMPATNPADMQGPITVKWTGKLRVVPLEGEHDASLAPGKALVRLTGAPVVITHQDMTAHSGVVAYSSATGAASLTANDIVPMVTMKLGGSDEGGADVATPSLTYVQQPDGKRLATLVGESRAVMAGKDGQQPLTLTWNKDGRIRLIDLPGGKSVIEQADFEGKVKVVHPDLDMTGNALSLAFDPPPATQPATPATPQTATGTATTAPTTLPAAPDPADLIREIVATGDVNCRMRDGSGDAAADRNIAAQTLKVHMDVTPAGERYARIIDAAGNVKTNQGADEMEAGKFRAELLPPTPTTKPMATVDASDSKPAVAFGGIAAGGKSQLKSLVARDAVKLKTGDGSTAAADTLEVVTIDGHEEYRLSGAPVATVTQEKTVITGPRIRFAPDAQIAEVIGAGGMKGTLPDDPKQSFDITWAERAVVNGATNLIDVTKQVVIKSVQADGTINTATSSKLQAKLEPKPTTAPTQPATTAAVASSKPSQADKMSFLAGKEITSATLTSDAPDRVEVKSEQFAANGELLRGINLYATTVITNRATGRLDVPVPGKMLVQDHRPLDQKPAANRAGASSSPAQEGPTVGSGRGNTAFKWSQSLVYDDTQQQAVMTGDVVVVHHPMTQAGQPFNLWADKLTAQMEGGQKMSAQTKQPKPPPAAAAAADADKDKQDKMQLRRVLASGHARVESVRMNIDAAEISYDPVSQVLHAIGNESAPIHIVDKEKGTTSTAGELEWNTATDQFHVKDLSGKVRS